MDSGIRENFGNQYKNKLNIMRRKDREVSKEEALSILTNAKYGILSTVSNNSLPYGVPISFCLISGNLYFHCALEGRKVENINQNNNVSFCAVGNTEVMPDKFGTKYESVILSGKVSEVFDKNKKIALKGILEKYSPSYMEKGLKYIDKLIDKTKIFKIEIDTISGKACK